jgi:(E)-4-hydroxy-3-methylbut-2-enyl-diphosphate synthase
LEAADELAQGGLSDIKVSVKASSVGLTVEANRLLAERCDWPIHLGLTEAGVGPAAAAKSAVACSLLLAEGIGDTVRFSLCGDPIGEVRAACSMLRCLGLRTGGLEVVACPSCGRAHRDVAAVAGEVEARLSSMLDRGEGLTVAVMGCEVNGPGEAKSADVGIAATRSGWVLFCRGRVADRLEPQEGVSRLVEEARELISQQRKGGSEKQ